MSEEKSNKEKSENEDCEIYYKKTSVDSAFTLSVKGSNKENVSDLFDEKMEKYGENKNG